MALLQRSLQKKCNNMSKRSLRAINQSIQKDNVNISEDKVKIKQLTQNLINLSEHTIRALNRSTRKGEEVPANILKLYDDNTDYANILVLDSPIDDKDDELTEKSSSHVSETHIDNCTNVPKKCQKRQASVQAMQKINNITQTEANILQTNSDVAGISMNISFIERLIDGMYKNMLNHGTDDQATIFFDDDTLSKTFEENESLSI